MDTGHAIKMSKPNDWILKRLERLIKLLKHNNSDVKPTDDELFSHELIGAQEMYNKVNGDDLRSVWEMSGLMKDANRIWRTQRKIYNGELDNNWEAVLLGEVEDFLEKNQKINAIKHYRNEMANRVFGKEPPGLKESKEFVDGVQKDMINRGILKT